MMRSTSVAGAVLVTLFASGSQGYSDEPASDAPTRVAVAFSGGHETVGRDRGRPVVLIAGALGVPAEVFREAFTRVHPAAPGTGGPTPEEARANKQALLQALAPYGITNERLDEVSNYYRYRRGRGQIWPTNPAVAYALVKKGRITGFVVTDGGSGYSSPPVVSVPGAQVNTSVQLSLSQEFENNGAVASITLAPARTRQ